MQPSEMEIAREMENIRSIRRISSQSGPGSLALDPDLPSASSPLSPQRRSPISGTTLSTVDDEDGSAEDGLLADDPSHLFWVPAHLHPELAPGEFRAFLQERTRTVEEGDPSETPGSMLRRVASGAAGKEDGGLGRRTSMLSRQYKPREGDGVGEEEEKIVPVKRTRSIYGKSGPHLTISDLQKLESLADEASKSNDPTQLRSVIRRSMSLNLPLSFIDQMDDLPADDADAPIIVPKQTLQRAQRTKIRKPGLPGDGGGHRFAATRRGQRGQTVDGTRPSSDMSSVSDHGDEPFSRLSAPNHEIEDELAAPSGTPVEVHPIADDSFADGSGEQRTSSPAETGEDDDHALISSSPPNLSHIPATIHSHSLPPEDKYAPVPVKEQRPLVSPSQVELPPSPYAPHLSQSPTLQHPQPMRHLDVPGAPPGTRRSPSPGGSGVSPPSSPSPEPALRSESVPSPEVPLLYPHSMQPSRQPLALPATLTPPGSKKEKDKHDKHKEKDKKGGLFGWGSGKEKKKGDKEKSSIAEREKEKEGGGGFFGFFSGGKKKHDEHTGSGITHVAGREAAAALLGQSRGKTAGPLMGLIAPGGLPGQHSRYPIHVERAIYRLSHIKLANPRRPLYEQVLISNLMFWYLGIINKPPVPPGGEKPTQQQVTNAGLPNGQPPMVESQSPVPTPDADDQMQAEAREQDEKERQEQEMLLAEQREREMHERERVERERLERERAAGEREKTKKGGLTKAERAPQSAAKRAEIPVRGPGFGMQHQMIEQEYGQQQQYARQQAAGRPGGPAPVIQPQASYHLPQRIQHGPPPRPPRAEPPQNTPQQPYFYQQDVSHVSYQPMTPYVLPPGAKAPAAVENSWAINVVSSASGGGATSPTSPPPPQRHGGGAADGSLTGKPHPHKVQTHPPAAEYLQTPPGPRPGRSLSANAISTHSSLRSSGASPTPFHPQPPAHQQHHRHNSQQPTQVAHPSSAYGPPYASTPVLNGSGGQPSHSPGRLTKKKSAGGVLVHSGSTGSTGKNRRKSLDQEPYQQRQKGAPNPEEDFSLAMWQQYQVQQQQGYGQQQQLPNGQRGQQSYR